MNANEYNQRQLDDGSIDGAHITAMATIYQEANGLEVDGKFGPNTAAKIDSHDPDRVARARSAVGRGTKYVLGKGGWNPQSEHPGTQCDCSGFISWVISKPRNYKYGGHSWISTTDIYNDGRDGNHLFRQIPTPEPGCIVVYGDAGGSQGHCAIVTNTRPLEGIDCSSSQSRKTGDAISERSITFFLKKNSIFVVPVGDD